MKTTKFTYRSRIAAPAYAVFRWHARPDAFEKLTPPWMPVKIHERTGGIRNGAHVELLLGPWPLQFPWMLEHWDYVEGRQFRDVQRWGPFAHWEHVHKVTPDGTDACWLEDRIEYKLPFGWLGRLLAGEHAERILQRLFEYRHCVTAKEVTRAGGNEAA